MDTFAWRAAETIAHTICQAVPNRQLVFTIPERLRLVFRHDRRLLGEVARAAWESVVEVYRDVPRRGHGRPNGACEEAGHDEKQCE